MSEYIRRIDEADKAVREAKRALNNAEKEREKKLKQIGREIRENEEYITKPRKTYAGISLYIDHIEYQKQSYVLNENTYAEVTAGAGAEQKAEEKSLYIHVRSDEGEFTAVTKSNDEAKARQFADEINSFAVAAEQEVEMAQNNLDDAREKLREAEADFTEINRAAEILEEKQQAKRALEASSSAAEREQLDARNKKRKKMTVIAAAVVLILAAALFSKPKKDKTPDTAPVAAETEKPEKTPEPTPAPTPEATPEPAEEPAQTASGIRPEFQKSMEAYEAFFDEYVAFMKDIDEDNVSLDQMSRYLDFLNKYSEAMEALEAIDESTLTPEEDLLYAETMLRIDKKLLEAAN